MSRKFKVRRSLRKEFKSQVRFALIAAVGFVIAFAWRNTIWDSSRLLIEKFSTAAGVVLTDVYTALFITFFGVILLIITSKLLKDK